MLKSVEDKNRYCSACFTNIYPTELIPDKKQKSLFGETDASTDAVIAKRVEDE
jgi:hypothetical protein